GEFTGLEDLNRQALEWRDRVALARRWPQDDSRIVGEVFEEEKTRLIPLPANRFETELKKTIRSGKTIYVRFDLNDYSIPHTMVRRSLTLAAASSTVRVLDGDVEVARHYRSYDRGQRIEDPSHIAALVEKKPKALAATAVGRLSHAIPNVERFLDSAFEWGESVASQTTQLIELLDEYGAQDVREAVNEALASDTPHAA